MVCNEWKIIKSDCEDKVSNCRKQLDEVDYCNSQDDEIKKFFLEQCPKSCGKCKYVTPLNDLSKVENISTISLLDNIRKQNEYDRFSLRRGNNFSGTNNFKATNDQETR